MFRFHGRVSYRGQWGARVFEGLGETVRPGLQARQGGRVPQQVLLSGHCGDRVKEGQDADQAVAVQKVDLENITFLKNWVYFLACLGTNLWVCELMPRSSWCLCPGRRWTTSWLASGGIFPTTSWQPWPSARPRISSGWLIRWGKTFLIKKICKSWSVFFYFTGAAGI